MRGLRLVGLCVVAAFAIAAAAAGTASAEAPEYGRCVKKAGKPSGAGFKNGSCTEAVGRKAHFEWVPGPGANAKFSSKGKIVYTTKYRQCSRALFEEEVAVKDRERGFIVEAEMHEEKASQIYAAAGETKAGCEVLVEEETALSTAVIATGTGVKLKCAGVASHGEYSGPKTIADLTMTFTECSLKDGAECTSPGAEEGEIVTSTLAGELGVIGKFVTKKKKHVLTLVGVDAVPAPPGTVVTEFNCAGEEFKITGSVIRELRTNAMVTMTNEGFTQSAGIQYPGAFEGQPFDVLSSTITENGVETGPFQTGLGTKATVTNEEPIEVSTTL
jgi:hypothetical protein